MKHIYQLEIMNTSDLSTPEKTLKAWNERKVLKFEGLETVWNYLGFKLNRLRYGWSGAIGDTDYTLTRIM